MTISIENAGKIMVEGKFYPAVCRKGIASNSTLYQCCKCWMHKRCSGISSELKGDSKFKCQAYANQQTHIEENCPSIELILIHYIK